MNGSYDFIIVGCDGMWDTITPEEANEIVFDHLEEKKAEGEDNEKISSQGSWYAEADLVGISSTSEYVFSSGDKVSMESSKEKPDFSASIFLQWLGKNTHM